MTRANDPPSWGPGYTREEWRQHCREWSLKYKKLHQRQEPDRRGMKYCPRCKQYLSRKKEFAIALRQPDGLRQYCNSCNNELYKIWYWTQRFRAVETEEELTISVERALSWFPLRRIRRMAEGSPWEGTF